MKLSEFRQALSNVKQLDFLLPNGAFIPSHFHITEAGLITRHYIDCGGTVRIEKYINFQIWVADDTDHRLNPEKLEKIIQIAEPLWGSEDLNIEVEYQEKSISRYGIYFNGTHFLLQAKQTECLAKDKCGVPPEKVKIKLSELQPAASTCCTPGGGCC